MAGITGNLDPPDADSPTGGGTSYFIRRAFDHPYCCYMLCHRHNGPIPPVVAILNIFLMQDLSYQPPVALPLHGMVPITEKALMDMFAAYARELVNHIRKDLPPAGYLLYKAKWDALPHRGHELFLPTDVKPIHTQSTKSFHRGLHTDLCETVAIPLHHGWLVDPKESVICQNIGERTYAELPHDLQNVLDVWRDQITPYGMSLLSSCLEDDRNSLVLRNGSLILVRKDSGTLFELVTDEMYCRTYNAMWKIPNPDAAEVFFTADLRPLHLHNQPHKTERSVIEWFEKREEEEKQREEDAKKREEENLQSFLVGTNVARKSDSNKPANVKRDKKCRNRNKANKTDSRKMKEESDGSGTKTPAKLQGSGKSGNREKKRAMPRKEEDHNEREQSDASEVSLGGHREVSPSKAGEHFSTSETSLGEPTKGPSGSADATTSGDATTGEPAEATGGPADATTSGSSHATTSEPPDDARVGQRLKDFLQMYYEEGAAGCEDESFYVRLIKCIISGPGPAKKRRFTMQVNYQDIADCTPDLAHALQSNYNRLKPLLDTALVELINEYDARTVEEIRKRTRLVIYGVPQTSSKIQSFVEYVVDNNLFEPYVLYDGTKINITSSAGRKVGRGYLSFVVRMHRRNRSWNGDFKLSDLAFKDGEFVILKPTSNDATRLCAAADLDKLLTLLNEYFRSEEQGVLPAYFDLLRADCTINMPDPKSEARETELFRRYLEHHLAFKSPEARSALFHAMHKICKANRTVADGYLVYQPLNHSSQFDWRRDIRKLAATEIFKKVYDEKNHLGLKYSKGSYWHLLRYIRHFDEHMMDHTVIDGIQQVEDIIQMDLILGLHFELNVGNLMLEMMRVLTEKKFSRIWSSYETSV